MSNVIIGIGGTGGKVIRALRNRISQSRSDDNNHYLCLDTMGYGYFLQEIYGDKAHVQNLGGGEDLSASMSAAEVNKIIQDLAGNSKTAIAQDEYLQLRGLPPRILGELLEDPYAQNGAYNWLRAKDFKSVFNVSDRVFAFSEGAGQYRQIGRIASFVTAAEIQRRLGAIEQKSRPTEGNSRSVYIICSLAGGTGAGNFMDLGVLARSVFSSGRQRAKEGDDFAASDSVNLLLLMNGAFGQMDFSSGSNADMEVIAHAVLRELGRLQLAPLPKSDWVFNYPEVGTIPIEDQTVFDQVCLFDFVAENKVGESYRQETVYPGMAEMVDLLTSPGTGAKVNVSLVNLNKKIRMAQARTNNSEVGQAIAEAWKDDQFSPFFSTFNSFRILFPRLAYQKKARARAVDHFIDRLLGDSMGRLENRHVQEAYSVSNWPVIKPLFDSLFGEAVDKDFNLSNTQGATDENATPATVYLDQNENQLNKFLSSPLKELVNLFGGDLTAYSRAHIGDGSNAWKEMPEANRDINMREDLKKDVDLLRQAQFARRDLKDLGINLPSLVDQSGVAKAVNRALAERQKLAETNVDEALGSLLRNPSNVSESLWIFRSISTIFLHALRLKLEVRLDRINSECNQIQAATTQSLATLEGITKKGKDYKEAAENYLLQEKKLFSAHYTRLVNIALIAMVDSIDDRVIQWTKRLEEMVSNLILPEISTSVKALSTGVINETNAQLSQWAKSDNVSLGIPGHLANDADTTMGGFEQLLCDDLVAAALSADQVRWELNSEAGKQELALIYTDDAEQTHEIHYQKGRAFAELESLCATPVERVFNGWSLYRYICEYVCENDITRMDTVAQELTQKLSGLESKIQVGSAVEKVVTERYLTCSSPSSEQKTNHANEFMDLFESKAAGVSLDFSRIETSEASDEIGLVRLDSGLTTGSVGKLDSCRQKYEGYIRNDSKVLPLVHIFSEEENMVVREREMHQHLTAGDQRVLPNALSQIFGNKHLLELFLALYYTGFVIEVNASDKMSTHYWLYANYSKLNALLKGSIEDLQRFTSNLDDSPEQHYGDMMDLNDTVRDAQAGSLFSDRIVQDAPDFFNAMVRFVQRMPNGDEQHPSIKSFPFNMQQVAELRANLKNFWAKSHEGDQAIRKISDDLAQWSVQAKKLTEIEETEWSRSVVESNVVDEFEIELGVGINASALTQAEAVEFLEQVGKSLTHYYHSVRPSKKKRKRGF